MATVSELSMYQVRGQLGLTLATWHIACSQDDGLAAVAPALSVPYAVRAASTSAPVLVQATALKLGAEKEELESEVSEAKDRFLQGMAPTEDCEREWYRLERTRLMMDDYALARTEERQALESKVSALIFTAGMQLGRAR